MSAIAAAVGIVLALFGAGMFCNVMAERQRRRRRRRE